MMKAILIMVIVINLIGAGGLIVMTHNDKKIDNKITMLYRDDYLQMSNYLMSKHSLGKDKADFWAVPIINASKRFDLPPKVLSSIVQIESNFKAWDTSFVSTSVGRDKLKEYAIGPYQMKPSTAKQCCDEIGIEFKAAMLHDPEMSSIIAAYYLRHLMLMFDNNLQAAVKAYNVGPQGYRDRLCLESQDKFWASFQLYYN